MVLRSLEIAPFLNEEPENQKTMAIASSWY